MKIWSNESTQFPTLVLPKVHTTTGLFTKQDDRLQLPDKSRFLDRCSDEANNNTSPLCINLEHWDTDVRKSNAYSLVDGNIRKLMEITAWAQEAFPNRIVGHYAIFPIREYWVYVLEKKTGIMHLRRANGYLKKSRNPETGRFDPKGLPDMCHVTFPSLYTFYNNMKYWVKYAKANIEEARKYQKPIWAYIWPRFHNSNDEIGMTGIPYDFWYLQLETLKELSIDNIVIWDAANYFARVGHEIWKDDTPWIRATRDFIEVEQKKNKMVSVD